MSRITIRFLSAALVVLLGLLTVSPSLFAGEPPTEPQLRIEAGMHTTVVRRVSTDSRGRWALTAGDDKTGRVWNISTGRLMMILRPPVGPGNESKLYSCALSPDGDIAALGGWTGYDWYGEHHIYLFDRSSGKMLQRLTGIPNVINHMAFSPDGRFLAASLGGANGIRVWDMQQPGSSPMEDRSYEGATYGLSWSRDGRHLATTCYDGYLRLYKVSAGQLKTMATVSANGGMMPFGIAFSPNGKYLLVGYEDSLNVELYNGRSLAFLQVLPIPEATGSLLSVAWSDDGRYAFAGGRYQKYVNGGWYYPVRRWPISQPDQFIEIPTSQQTIMSMVPLPDGRILMGSFDPYWGIISESGTWQPVQSPPIADFRDQTALFSVSDNGAVVQFGYQVFGKEPWHFSLSGRRLEEGPDSRALAPDMTSVSVENWRNSQSPAAGGTRLDLERYEMSRSFAAAPDGRRFVLGCDWYLRGFDSAGKLLWKIPAPGPVWAVNITADGKTVVAAYGDGTIRWHRLKDGAEYLAFFPHADQKRWILWTPSGYYDASVGGEELIGWQVNRGIAYAADFFPAGRFRDLYYRPDVVDMVLRTGDEKAALAEANRNRGRDQVQVDIVETLPPVIDLISPAEINTAENEVTVRFIVRTQPDAPVTAVRSRVNGQVTDTRGFVKLTRKEQEQTVTVTIPRQSCEIQLFAESRNGVSVPALVRVNWTGSADEFVILPKLYVLAIGVGDYKHADIPKLALSGKDARDFSATMRGQKGKMYREVEVVLLTDKEATRDGILEGLDWLQKSVTQHDVGMLFLSGHGVNDPAMGYVYLPHNADPDRLRTTGVPMYEFKVTLANLTGKAVFFLDTCHSGNVLGETRRAASNDIAGVINDLSSAENGVVVFSSSTGRQYSLESPEWGNGAFTKALVEGLTGKADYQGTGRITFKMLDLYVSERVKQLTGGQQSPVTQAPGGVPDFPLAVR